MTYSQNMRSTAAATYRGMAEFWQGTKEALTDPRIIPALLTLWVVIRLTTP